MLRSFTETRPWEAFILFLLLRLVHISAQGSFKESLHSAWRGDNAPQFNHKHCLQSLNVKNRSSGTTPNSHLSLRWKMPVGSHGSLSVVGEVMSLCDNLQTFILHIFKDNLNIFSFILWKTESYRNCLTNSPTSQVSCWAQAVPSMVSQHRISTVSYIHSLLHCLTPYRWKKKPKHYESQRNKWEQVFFSSRICSVRKAQVKLAVLCTVAEIWTLGRLETGAA